MVKNYRKLARKAAKKAKLEKANQAVKAPEEPGAKTSEEHKVEGGGEGTERGLEVGVEGNELLIFTQQIGEKAEILRRKEGRAENEEGKGTEESEMGDRVAVKAEDKPEEEGRGKEPEMGDGEAVRAEEDKPQEDQRSKEPEIGGPKPLKSGGAEEISGGEEEKRVDPQAGYARGVP
jgi:hypothetical protein